MKAWYIYKRQLTIFRGQNFIRKSVVNKSIQRQNAAAQKLCHLHKDCGFPPSPPPSILFWGEERARTTGENAELFREGDMKLKKGQQREKETSGDAES